MADTKTTALTAMTTPVGTDLIYVVDDPGGTPASQKVTFANSWTNYYKGVADALYQPLDSDLTAIAALTTTTYGRALLTQADEAALLATINLEIGTDVQAHDAGLDSIAGLTTAANKGIYTTASDTYATYDLTAAGLALLDDADASAQRTTLGLAIGSDVQAYDAGLASIAGLTTAANKGIYTTDSDTYATYDLTSAGRALLDDADASAQRTTLGLAIGTDVLAYDADVLFADVGDNFTAGYTSDSYSRGTISSGTVTPAPTTSEENFQHYTNNGAHTLAPPASPCSVVIEITNGASAGAITTSGFTSVGGDSLTTTEGHIFIAYITKVNASSSLYIEAMQ